MRSGGHALRGAFGGKAGAQRETAANPFADRHDVGRDAGFFIGEQTSGASNAGLHFIEDQEQPARVAEFPQALEEAWRRTRDTHFALDRLNQNAGGLRPARRTTASKSPSGTWSKPSTGGPKPSRYFGLPPAAMVASVRP